MALPPTNKFAIYCIFNCKIVCPVSPSCLSKRLMTLAIHGPARCLNPKKKFS